VNRSPIHEHIACIWYRRGDHLKGRRRAVAHKRLGGRERGDLLSSEKTSRPSFRTFRVGKDAEKKKEDLSKNTQKKKERCRNYKRRTHPSRIHVEKKGNGRGGQKQKAKKWAHENRPSLEHGKGRLFSAKGMQVMLVAGNNLTRKEENSTQEQNTQSRQVTGLGNKHLVGTGKCRPEANLTLAAQKPVQITNMSQGFRDRDGAGSGGEEGGRKKRSRVATCPKKDKLLIQMGTPPHQQAN